MEKKSHVLQIAGKRFVVRSEADETYVQSLADYVDQRVRELERSSRPTAPQTLAVLAALQIADELFQERERRQTLRRQVLEGSDALLDYLDQEVERLSQDS